MRGHLRGTRLEGAGLERDGSLSRTVHPAVPPQVEYALTDTGHSLLKVVQMLAYRTEDHVEAVSAARAAYDRRALL